MVVLPAGIVRGHGVRRGDLVAALAGGRVPERDRVADPRGRASGVLSWTLELGVAQGYETFLVVPFHGQEIGPGPHCGRSPTR